MIDLHESMGLGQVQTHATWIINQTRYQLHYVSQLFLLGDMLTEFVKFSN